jgi:precorrin-8X/cobalt-precorrin-8 methylmutase
MKKGREIEDQSMAIIDQEAGRVELTLEQYQVARRMVHATADFDFFKNARFHPEAVAGGLKALRFGCNLVADTFMLTAGLTHLPLVVKTVVKINEPETKKLAEVNGLTRAAASMRRSAQEMDDGIVAIGNAPTALLEVIRLVREKDVRPALIIGLPVGFVNAAESKEELTRLGRPYITVLGRKGGSPAAAAAVNALADLLSGSRG